jgi:Ca2+-binding RTX toxin-like protein
MAITRLTALGDLYESYSDNEIVLGLAGGDSLTTYGTGVTLDGGDGDDALYARGTNAVLKGGSGNDFYYYTSPAQVIEFGDQGNDSILTTATYFNLNDHPNIENVYRTGIDAEDYYNSAILIGNALDNMLSGSSGNDRLSGGSGDDRLDGSTGFDTLLGGKGNDTFVVTQAETLIIEKAGEGNDTVEVQSLSYSLVATQNVENVYGFLAYGQTLSGNDANNTISVALLLSPSWSSDSNYLFGLGGDDRISGNELHDELHGGTGDDTLTGARGNDILNGGLGNDDLNGGMGDDTMTGGAGNDTYYVDSLSDIVIEEANGGFDTVYTFIEASFLARFAHVERVIDRSTQAQMLRGDNFANHLDAGKNDDILYGYDGNDILDGHEGDDLLIGGRGEDVYVIDSYRDRVVEQKDGGYDFIQSDLASISLSNFDSIEGIYGTGSNDKFLRGNEFANIIQSGSGDDILSGFVGDDALFGYEGNDSLVGGSGNDVLMGGEGNDTINGGVGGDNLVGESGNDTYYVDSVNDYVAEGEDAGIDVIYTSLKSIKLDTYANIEKIVYIAARNELVYGDANSNTIETGSGNDRISGGAGHDKLASGGGKDTLFGGIGNDALDGGVGSDSLFGGSGNDVLFSGGGADVMNGGTGRDVVNYADGLSAVISLDGSVRNSGAARGDTYKSIENVVGSRFGGDTLIGNTSANMLSGLAGEDTLNGNAGNDLLRGGVGADCLIGGSGQDKFVYERVSEGGDHIVDFSYGDTVVFRGETFGQLQTGSLDDSLFCFSTNSNRAQDADDRFVLNMEDRSLWFDADGSGAGKAKLIAYIDNIYYLVASDIVIV